MAKSKSETDVDEILKAIGRTQILKDKIHAELGITPISKEQSSEDMYEFSYKKPDLNHVSYIILHGKCIGEGQKELLSWGYVFTQLRTFPAKDKTFCRVSCQFCKKLLDEAEAKKYLQERAARMKKQHEEYLEEKALREEWEAEQILLGKM